LSKIPVFEEVAGGAARYVDPMDVEGWRHAIEEAIDAGPQGPRRGSSLDLTRFSWRASAAATLDLYRRLGRIEHRN
jgi:glycosyltransferase involved in cell wall biosynthesis